MLLLGLMVVSAFAEVVSLGAVLPFLGVLMSPERIFRYHAVAVFAHRWGIASPAELVFPLTVAFVAAAVIAGIIRMLMLWVSTRLAFATGSDLSIEVYRRTLWQPYRVHVARNTSEVISGIIDKVSSVTFVILLPVLTLLSSALLLVTMTLALVAIDPMIALLATAAFGISYGVISLATRSRLTRNSRRIAHEQTQVVKALQEGLGGIRDVLLDGTQPIYCDVYRRADHPLRRAQGANVFMAQSPRFAMESVGTVLIAVLAYVLSHRPGGIAAAVPVLGALALGAQRLLPSLQQCYAAWASITGSHAALAETIELLDQPIGHAHEREAIPALAFRDAIRFDDVRFRYHESAPWVLDGLDLTIPKGTRLGIVGPTGSGKSTLLDILMGLLEPTGGRLLVDGAPIEGDRRVAWQRAIAHVPQVIYLADATLAENIAFGVPWDEIDWDRVRDAARRAQIAEYVERQPGGYRTMVGERGIRLSGGQRQRVGIARALYKEASVLVFDEATSALDNSTERLVMDAIDGLDSDLTILLIAHRLTTVRRCDTIVELSGRVVAQGTFEELLATSPTFRHMASAVR